MAGTGDDGHLAAMSEVVRRGYNVAVPWRDIGEDFWAIDDRNQRVIRVQVKTSKAKLTEEDDRFRYRRKLQFKCRRVQMAESDGFPFVYIFVTRFKRVFHFIVVPRADLLKIAESTRRSGDASKYFSLVAYFYKRKNTDRVSRSINGEIDTLAPYLEDWTPFPRIRD